MSTPCADRHLVLAPKTIFWRSDETSAWSHCLARHCRNTRLKLLDVLGAPHPTLHTLAPPLRAPRLEGALRIFVEYDSRTHSLTHPPTHPPTLSLLSVGEDSGRNMCKCERHSPACAMPRAQRRGSEPAPSSASYRWTKRQRSKLTTIAQPLIMVASMQARAVNLFKLFKLRRALPAVGVGLHAGLDAPAARHRSAVAQVQRRSLDWLLQRCAEAEVKLRHQRRPSRKSLAAAPHATIMEEPSVGWRVRISP
eukprot:SAG11_NODE_218_length_12212_cov_7.026005_2_plen_252_part_00